jgi:hypothetical protein
MDDMGQNPVILPPQVPSSQRYEGQAIDKPTSVTVFGVLNCVFGGLGLLCTPFTAVIGLASMYKTMGVTAAYTAWNIFAACVGFGLSIWLLTLGIGLLMMKRWARRGSVVYSIANIIWAFVVVGINIVALSLGWVTMPESQMAGFIGGTCGGLCGGMIYPVLLLIFMQTTKVKQAFSAIGG